MFLRVSKFLLKENLCVFSRLEANGLMAFPHACNNTVLFVHSSVINGNLRMPSTTPLSVSSEPCFDFPRAITDGPLLKGPSSRGTKIQVIPPLQGPCADFEHRRGGMRVDRVVIVRCDHDFVY